jgi:hypothetical protein
LRPPADDDALLDRLERDAFSYFWFETTLDTGLTKDRAGTLEPDEVHLASIAATGFALSALVVGAERGYLSRDAAAARAVLMLRRLTDRLPREHGWFYHFYDRNSAHRAGTCEVSSVDSALLFYGALTAGQYFGGDCQKLAEALFAGADWSWMLDGGDLVRHGWTPEHGFIKYRWDHYSETQLIVLLGLGSPKAPLPARCWSAWSRANVGDYHGHHTFATGLFTFNYNGAYIDWRGRRDPAAAGLDYAALAEAGVRANHDFCLAEEAAGRGSYDESFWGLSATDTPDGGYRAYFAPPHAPDHDGTICPWAVAGALPWAPDLVMPTLRGLLARYGGSIYGRYGFVSAANRRRNWVRTEAIGIDVGAALLNIENQRSGLIWRTFAASDVGRRALAAAGVEESAPRR